MPTQSRGVALNSSNDHIGPDGAALGNDPARFDGGGRGPFDDGPAQALYGLTQPPYQPGRIQGRGVSEEQSSNHTCGIEMRASFTGIEDPEVGICEPKRFLMVGYLRLHTGELRLVASQTDRATFGESAIDVLAVHDPADLVDGIMERSKQMAGGVVIRFPLLPIRTSRKVTDAPSAVPARCAKIVGSRRRR